MFKILLMFTFITSCTLVKVYKVKDIRKSYSKGLSQLKQTEASFTKDVEQQVKILASLKKETNVDLLLRELSHYNKKMKTLNLQLHKEVSLYQSRFTSLSLTERKIKSTDKKRFEQVTRYSDQSKEQAERLNSLTTSYQVLRTQFYSELKEKGFTFIDVKSVKKQFLRAKAKFKLGLIEAKNKLLIFKASIRKHAASEQINRELAGIDHILIEQEQDLDAIEKLVLKFHKAHGQSKKFIYGPSSSGFKDLEKIKLIANKSKRYKLDFDLHQKKINSLIRK